MANCRRMLPRSACATVLMVAAAIAAAGELRNPASSTEAPRLVVVIVVDQLRGDLPGRPYGLSGKSGFSRFFQKGVIYKDAQLEHAATLTAPGHATVFTGAQPVDHGIVANEWYSRAERRRVDSVSDPDEHTFGTNLGHSPRHLRTETIGDQLVVASAGRSKVFAVSGKDRGAILPAGRLGKAFWYVPQAKGFSTSTYYYERLPDWIERWNARAPRAVPAIWESLPRAGERALPPDADELKRPPPGMNQTFPHRLGSPGTEHYFSNMRFSPFLDELTFGFAEALIADEALGADADTDLLAISLSSTDYIGHAFGPGSREAADNLLRLDRRLARFFAALDESVGEDRYLVVLTADHGGDAIPEYKSRLGLPAYRLDLKTIMSGENDRLRAHYRIEADLIEAVFSPFVYLDFDALQAHGLDRREVTATLVEMLEAIPGIARAIPTDSPELMRSDGLARMIGLSIHAERSGNVYIAQEPSAFLANDAALNAAMHGSPYAYDRHVPLMVYGPGVKVAKVARRVAPAAIAPTLAAYLHIPAPPHAHGEVLAEIVGATY